MKRRQARELALQVLFQMDLTGCDVDKAWRDGLEREQPDPEVAEYAERLVRGVAAHRAEIDAEIARRSRDWPLERMATTDRNVLRIGFQELLYHPDVPASVAANEAVELAKVYGTADSGRFVNGILGAWIRERLGGAAPQPAGPEPPAGADAPAAGPAGATPARVGEAVAAGSGAPPAGGAGAAAGEAAAGGGAAHGLLPGR